MNLYSNVPLDTTIDLAINLLNDYFTDSATREDINRVLKHVVNQNFCMFNNSFYKINDGLPMGMPLSGLLADIYMDHIEDQHIINNNNPYHTHIKKWIRYVDDVFCIWDGGVAELNAFLDYLNNLHTQLKLTMEVEEERQLNFLDLTVTRNNTTIQYNIYRKPTHCDTIIPFDSNHHMTHRMAAFRFMFNRCLTYPLTQEQRDKEFHNIYNIAKTNGFPKKLVDRTLRKILITKDPLYTPPCNIEKVVYRAVNYCPSIIKTKSILEQYNIKLAYRSTSTINQILSNYKTTKPKEERSGVYCISCQECNAVYVGQTGRKLEKRVKEHQVPGRNSKVYHHWKCTGHAIDYKGTQLLHNCESGYRMDLLEHLEIAKRKLNPDIRLLNCQSELLYKPMLDSLELG